MDARDLALQAVNPCVLVPKFSKFQPIHESGHRFMLSSDGLWMEVYRPWLYATLPIAKQEAVLMPYGKLDETIQFQFSVDVVRIITKVFVREAERAYPNECAAWFIWNENSGLVRLQMLEYSDRSNVHVDYDCPTLEEHEHMVGDIHSHGVLNAFFSQEDNADDKGALKLAIVVGNINTHKPSIKARFCAFGKFVDMPEYEEVAL